MKKLQLNRETLRILAEAEQAAIQGGKVAPTPSAGGTCKATCRTCQTNLSCQAE